MTEKRFHCIFPGKTLASVHLYNKLATGYQLIVGV